MIALEQVKSFIDGAAVYFTVQLGRCAVCSVLILGMVLLLRRTVLKNSIFLKGAIWLFDRYSDCGCMADA